MMGSLPKKLSRLQSLTRFVTKKGNPRFSLWLKKGNFSRKEKFSGATISVGPVLCYLGPKPFRNRFGSVLEPFWNRSRTVSEPLQNRPVFWNPSKMVVTLNRWNRTRPTSTVGLEIVHKQPNKTFNDSSFRWPLEKNKMFLWRTYMTETYLFL